MLNIFKSYHSKAFLRPWLHVSTGLVSLLILTAFILSFFVFYKCTHYYFYIQNRFHQATSNIKNIEHKGYLVKQFESHKKENSKIFQHFNENSFGNKMSLDKARFQLQHLQKVYKIKNLTFIIGNHSKYSETLKLWSVPMVLTLKVLQDQQFFSFLDQICQNFPGKTILRKFSLKRVSPLTSDMVKQIIEHKKDITLFEGKIEFEWIYCGDDNPNIIKG